MIKLKHNQVWYCPENDKLYLYYGDYPEKEYYVFNDGTGSYIFHSSWVDLTKLVLIGEL